MGEKQLQELGYRLTGLKITTKISEASCLKHTCDRINLNFSELRNNRGELCLRGFSSKYLNLQGLLHEVAHYKQFLKYGKNCAEFFCSWYWDNFDKAEDTADRYALMYYKRFVKQPLDKTTYV